MSDNWKCRTFQPGDEAGIIDLYRDVFHLQMSPDLWRWMYLSLPAGPAVIVVLETDGRLVGHYGVQPREFWISGSKTTVGFAVGTMVQPELRSVKALVEMARLAYVSCRERGFSWLYAFPNDAAHKSALCAVGLESAAAARRVGWPIAAGQWRPFRHRSLLATVSLKSELRQTFSAEDGLACGSRHRIRSARSANFLRWRFFDRPGGQYVLHTVDDGSHVSGYAVVKRYVRDDIAYGHILDWRVNRRGQDRSTELLASLWNQFTEWEVERVSCWAGGEPQLELKLARAGLTRTGRKSNFCYFELQGGHSAELSEESAWQFDMADSDVY